MLINISDAQVIQPLLQRKSLSPEHLYLYSGMRYNPKARVSGESLVALETELTQSSLLYLQAQDLFEELDCCYKVLSKAIVDEDPESFVPVMEELAERFKHIAVHHFDLAYAYLAWHTSDDYPVMHHLLVALTLVRVGMCSNQFSEPELTSHLKAALTMNISMKISVYFDFPLRLLMCN